MEKTVTVCGIKRMEIHDGEGLRSTVFFKGCPLKCRWCHNPESISYSPQIAFFEGKCIGCGQCVSVCPTGAAGNVRAIDYRKCIGCGKCAEVCPTEALVHYGRRITVSALADELMWDAPFFADGKGGVTLSGGECLTQPEGVIELARELKKRGISVFVDTCGYVKREILEKILPYTDKFLYDIKALDSDVHEKCTGRDNVLILENLKYLSDSGARLEIRIPYVPDLNGGEMEAIARHLSKMNIEKVKILPYHNFAASRYGALGMESTLPDTLPTREQSESVRELFGRILAGVTVD